MASNLNLFMSPDFGAGEKENFAVLSNMRKFNYKSGSNYYAKGFSKTRGGEQAPINNFHHENSISKVVSGQKFHWVEERINKDKDISVNANPLEDPHAPHHGQPPLQAHQRVPQMREHNVFATTNYKNAQQMTTQQMGTKTRHAGSPDSEAFFRFNNVSGLHNVYENYFKTEETGIIDPTQQISLYHGGSHNGSNNILGGGGLIGGLAGGLSTQPAAQDTSQSREYIFTSRGISGNFLPHGPAGGGNNVSVTGKSSLGLGNKIGIPRKESRTLMNISSKPAVTTATTSSYLHRKPGQTFSSKFTTKAAHVEEDTRHRNPVVQRNPQTQKRQDQADKIAAEIISAPGYSGEVGTDIYIGNILQTLKSKDGDNSSLDCLKNHDISPLLRSKMVDWMVEVLSSYKCKDQTLFIAASIMDRYFRSTTMHTGADVHLLGVTCMFMAAKYEEIVPFKLSIVHEKVAHKKFSKEVIRDCEARILEALEFVMTSCTAYDYIQIMAWKFVQVANREVFAKLAVYVGKMMLFDYNIISMFGNSEIAAVALHVAGLIMKQKHIPIDLQFEILKLKNALIIEEKKHKQLLDRTIYLYNNFGEIFINMTNLDRFNEYDELVDKIAH